jgi:hypothetical protein
MDDLNHGSRYGNWNKTARVRGLKRVDWLRRRVCPDVLYPDDSSDKAMVCFEQAVFRDWNHAANDSSNNFHAPEDDPTGMVLSFLYGKCNIAH